MCGGGSGTAMRNIQIWESQQAQQELARLRAEEEQRKANIKTGQANIDNAFGQFNDDFYNRFLAPPAQLLTGDLRRYLLQSKVGPVREPGAPLSSDFIIQPRLDDLYADYRDTTRPRAVAAITMVLVARQPSGNKQVFEKTYRREIVMDEVSPAAALRGWNKGVGQIFWQFTRDLRAAGS